MVRVFDAEVFISLTRFLDSILALLLFSSAALFVPLIRFATTLFFETGFLFEVLFSL